MLLLCQHFLIRQYQAYHLYYSELIMFILAMFILLQEVDKNLQEQSSKSKKRKTKANKVCIICSFFCEVNNLIVSTILAIMFFHNLAFNI